ncbi:MAG: transporter [Bacteroidota bacterium]|nr:transporter [Bacteroidota bacterium]
MKLIRFIKNWTLPISMLAGAMGYFVYVNLPFLAPTRPFVIESVGIIQPLLIFLMLFVTFCKVDPRDLRLTGIHGWLLLIQAGTFCLLGLPLILFPDTQFRVVYEGAMICMITPTATAAAVITGKLGGNMHSLVSYTILINIVSAIIIPLVLPMVHPNPQLAFMPSFLLILSKVFPLLIFPFLLAWVVRAYLPGLHKAILGFKDLAFYLWAVALAIAIAVTVRSIVHSEVAIIYQAGIAIASLICCIFQFAVGRKIGGHYNDLVGGGQSLGQKSTVFSIWLGATFLSPVTSMAGGFYSIWHNVYNSYQLYQKRKADELKL